MGKKKPKAKTSKANSLTDTKYSVLRNLSPDPELDVIAAAINSANSVVFMKVCRLCESKDGPFLNIFDTEKTTSKKVEDLMPFGIAENDGLPHKICFRCSAKVEELYEFIQKCIKTQQNLHAAMGKKEPAINKPKTRLLWEEKLTKSNMSNDDICDALIKKAMEGIKDIPLHPLTSEEKKSTVNNKKENKPALNLKKETRSKQEVKSDEEELEMSLKDFKMMNDSKFIPIRTSRSQHSSDNLLDGLPDTKRKKFTNKEPEKTDKPSEIKTQENAPTNKNKGINDFSFDFDDSSKTDCNIVCSKETEKEVKSEIEKKPFNIMDHVSMIKVNGVGVLFQCKLCNRNFLKEDVVLSHGCAKTGVPKPDFTKNLVPPEPPKMPVVKYINTKVDNDAKKLPPENKEKQDSDVKKLAPVKPKPKIGPASKVKHLNEDYKSVIGMTVEPMNDSSSSQTKQESPPTPAPAPLVNFPSIPSLNSRYKLVPGPNNTFHLVEEPSGTSETEAQKTAAPVDSNSNTKTGRKRKGDEKKAQESKTHKLNNANKNRSSPEIIDLEDTPSTQSNSGSQPYPVGLFQTLPHPTADGSFPTPAMKKQSYTVVQTGNPSKLLISTKLQKPVEEVPKKKGRKPKVEKKPEPEEKQPFSVTLEDAAPPKDPGFFTFINVDPLLQPSYVLPTDNIIQESQISTSTPASKANAVSKDNYACNMCGEAFSREKKLLTHIQSHYSKMDEEDQMREEKSSKKRSKRH